MTPASSIRAGSPAWYAWLEHATTFAFASAEGGFTARKERRGRLAGIESLRKQAGTLHRAYLGKSGDLTYDRLNAIATHLAGRATGPPLESPHVVSPPPVTAEGDLSYLSAALLPTGTPDPLLYRHRRQHTAMEQHPQAMPAVLARHDAILREAIQAEGGVAPQTAGDGVHAVFARAADALAALAGQRGLQTQLGARPARCGCDRALHTGAAELRNDDYFGPSLNRVARILALAHGSQVLLSHATHDVAADDLPPQMTLRPLGEYTLKDLTRPELIFQLVSPDLPIDSSATACCPYQPGAYADPSTFPPDHQTLRPARPPPAGCHDHGCWRWRQVGWSGRLTLLCAPAGFGKTTLLSAWRATAAGSAMLSPGSRSIRPIRILSAILELCDRRTRYAPAQQWHHGTGAAPISQPPPIEAVLTLLLNALNTMATDAVLVLDDYHLIDAPPIHSALAFLLDHLPPRLHLILATRADPPLLLTRLRA